MPPPRRHKTDFNQWVRIMHGRRNETKQRSQDGNGQRVRLEKGDGDVIVSYLKDPAALYL